MSNLVSILWWIAKGIVYIAALGFSIVYLQAEYPAFCAAHQFGSFILAIVSPLIALGVLHVIVPEFVAYLVVLGIVAFLYPKYSQPAKNTTIAVPVPLNR